MIPRQIKLTGMVYIKYIDVPPSPEIGDIKLVLNDDATNLSPGDYENTKISGYIKAKVFDGLVWQNININELCCDHENKFIKKQKAIDTAILCRNIIITFAGKIMYKTYRGHFTLQEYQKTPYNRKSNNGKRS